MNRLSEFLGQSIGIEAWIASMLAIALVTIVLNQLAQVLLRKASQATQKTQTVWDDALVSTASRPILVVMWVIGLGYMARVLQRQVEEPFLSEVLALRESKSRPAQGIVTFAHHAYNQHGTLVASCQRTSLQNRRPT